MSLLGPEGFRDLGHLILSRARHAARVIGAIPGLSVPWAEGHLREVVVRFDRTGKTVAEVNDALRARGIFGGKDISGEGLGLGQAALCCVTEIHDAADIDRLAGTLREIVACPCPPFTPPAGTGPSSSPWAARAREGSFSPYPTCRR
jgi:glycine dehydrogenase subunit 1